MTAIDWLVLGIDIAALGAVFYTNWLNAKRFGRYFWWETGHE